MGGYRCTYPRARRRAGRAVSAGRPGSGRIGDPAGLAVAPPGNRALPRTGSFRSGWCRHRRLHPRDRNRRPHRSCSRVAQCAESAPGSVTTLARVAPSLLSPGPSPPGANDRGCSASTVASARPLSWSARGVECRTLRGSPADRKCSVAMSEHPSRRYSRACPCGCFPVDTRGPSRAPGIRTAATGPITRRTRMTAAQR